MKEDQIAALQKENAELKAQLEARQKTQCIIPMDSEGNHYLENACGKAR